MINEGMNIPPKLIDASDKLAKYIGSFILPDLKSMVDSAQKSGDHDKILTAINLYKLASKYRAEGDSMFKVKTKRLKGPQFGDTNLVISSKDKDVPPIYVRLEQKDIPIGYRGFYHPDSNHVSLIALRHELIRNFSKTVGELTSTLEHEFAHYWQHNAHGEKIVGLPKDKVMSKRADVYGRYNALGKDRVSGHELRDIEFKTNLKSYAYYLKRFLNQYYPKSLWVRRFKNLVSGEPMFTGDDEVDVILESISHMYRADRPRWRQFVKELYNEIFK